MRSLRISSSALTLLLAGCALARGADLYVSPDGGALPPFSSWDTAATNIQDAINAASAGDNVWVTNGVYATGGKVMVGDLTNRVVLDKALTVQSINGPSVTVIQGAWDPVSTNGPLAVRCAWLTNGATLEGFTLTGGATRSSGDLNGGGVWGSSTNAWVIGCSITGNCAASAGAGAYSAGLLRCSLTSNYVFAHLGPANGGGAAYCDLTNCVVSTNRALSQGGGAFESYLRNCAIVGNTAGGAGGGVTLGTLVNCTVFGNIGSTVPGPSGAGGTQNCLATNCIIYGNQSIYSGGSVSNYFGWNPIYCCTAPLPIGPGNIASDPQLQADGIHLSTASPCIAAGTNVASGTDIDGQPWATPPAIGCDEWYGPPLLQTQAALVFTLYPAGFSIGTTLVRADPFTCGWYKDGVSLTDGARLTGSQSTNLLASGVQVTDAGTYQLFLTNTYGVTTSAVVQVVVHCAAAGATNPVPPFLDWSTAASTVQDAIDAAQPGEFILVADGSYGSGGRVMSGDLTNRIALDKKVMVLSVDGPASASIQGAWDPVTTNGPLAVRCAWLTNGAVLSGFTLLGGATRNSGDLANLQSGGGSWCASTNEVLLNCILTGNAAANAGGGCYQGQVRRCLLLVNSASQGGGVYASYVASSAICSNTASSAGGGAHSSTLVNCTVTANGAPSSGGSGGYFGKAINSILFYNFPPLGGQEDDWEGLPSSLISCWTQGGPFTPLIPDPQLVQDFIHLAAGSPCLGGGNAAYSFGTDFDGEPWLNPPAIGCDQYYASDFTGPLSLGPITAQSAFGSGPVLRNDLALVFHQLVGKADRLILLFGDGTGVTNWFLYSSHHTWTNAGDFNVTCTAYNRDNPGGVSTNAVVHVSLPNPPLVSGIALTNNTFNLSFSTQPGITYSIDVATNLAPPVSWQPLGSLVSFGNMATSSDTSATNTARFYRIRAD